MATGWRSATVPEWARALSLRAKTVLLGSTVLTVVLVVSGVLLVVALRTTLTNGITQSGLLRAQDLAALAAQDRLPDPVPVAGDDEALAQVVGADGEVVTASAQVRNLDPLPLPRPPRGQSAVYELDSLPVLDDEAYRVAAVGVEAGGGLTTVYVAVSLDDVTDTVAATVGALAVALPVLVLVLSAGTWVLIGRTLSPVAAMTSEAADISPADLHRRLPLPAARDEVGRLARTLNGMLDRIEESARRQRRFVADAAHELRSPVTSLRAQLETARGSPAVDWKRVSEDLLAETVRLQRLAEELLVLARLDGTGATVGRHPVDLDDLAERAVLRLRGRAGVKLDASAVRPVQVPGDALLLERVLDNLLDNAVRHARSRVAVTTAAEDGVAVLAVEDDGPGIPEAQREQVLLPFTRLAEARDRASGGAGLGLAVARDVVSAHGGSLDVGESPLGGASFVVRLPV